QHARLVLEEAQRVGAGKGRDAGIGARRPGHTRTGRREMPSTNPVLVAGAHGVSHEQRARHRDCPGYRWRRGPGLTPLAGDCFLLLLPRRGLPMAQLKATISPGLWRALLDHAARVQEPLAHVVSKALAEYLQVAHHTLYQVSTATALVEGIYQGAVRV